MPDKPKVPQKGESMAQIGDAFDHQFFCERRQRILTQAECLEIFCFSNTLLKNDLGITTDVLCIGCPVGRMKRERLGGKLPAVSLHKEQVRESEARAVARYNAAKANPTK